MEKLEGGKGREKLYNCIFFSKKLNLKNFKEMCTLSHKNFFVCL